MLAELDETAHPRDHGEHLPRRPRLSALTALSTSSNVGHRDIENGCFMTVKVHRRMCGAGPTWERRS